MGLPLAAQFASHGWRVIAVDVNAGRRRRDQRRPRPRRRGARPRRARRARPTPPAASGPRPTARRPPATSDVVVLIVPVMLDDEQQPDYRYMDAAVGSIAPGVRAGATVIFETTLPVGDTRDRFAPAARGRDRPRRRPRLLRRVLAGAPVHRRRASANLATYPKLVGGIGPASTDRAARFYASVLDAEVVAMSSSEAAEFSKLADTTYRDVNIALRQRVRRATPTGSAWTSSRSSAAANSQPYSHIHQPGIGVGGHCIPVYPHFLLSRAPEMAARGALAAGQRRPGRRRDPGARRGSSARSQDVPVLVLGLTYREGVKELAYSRALPLIERLASEGARVSALGSAAVGRGDRGAGGAALGVGDAQRRARDRHPDGGPRLRPPRPGLVPGPGGHPRRPEQPAHLALPRARPACSGSVSRPAPATPSRVAPMTPYRRPQDHVTEPRGLLTVHAHPMRGRRPPAHRFGCGRARFSDRFVGLRVIMRLVRRPRHRLARTGFSPGPSVFGSRAAMVAGERDRRRERWFLFGAVLGSRRPRDPRRGAAGGVRANCLSPVVGLVHDGASLRTRTSAQTR